MNIIEKTQRDPDFYNDIDKFGKFAEDDFLALYYTNPLNKNKTLFDVRDNKEYQKIDVDFIIDNKGGENIPDLKTILYDKRFQKIEVKYNSIALKTGLIAYESISHKAPGWGDVTKCDLMYTVLTEENSFNIIKRMWIYMSKWKEFLADRKNYRKISFIKSEDIVDILCNLKDMENKGVIKYI